MRRLSGLLKARGAEAIWLALSSTTDCPVATQDFPPAALAPALPGLGVVQNLMYMDAVRYLPDDILVKLDRASMAVSLESRVPLLDHRILEFAASLSPATGLSSAGTKPMLRRLLYRYVPPAIVDRPKMGFGAPMRQWLRGPLRDWAEDLLDLRSLAKSGHVDAKAVRRMWSRYLIGAENSEDQLWSILTLQAWLQDDRPARRIARLVASR
jgi:asparagine synthase (glutamine-hydrolysing)